MKRPSFQFYPGDWRNNAKLRRCSWAQRGIWLETLGLMVDSDEYGVLRWPLKEIADVLGCRATELKDLAARAVLKGADSGERFEGFSFTPRHAGKVGKPVILIAACDGPVWFSSRLVEDEYKRAARSPKEEPDATPKRQPKHTIGGHIGDEQSQHHSRADPSSSSSASGGIPTVGGEAMSPAVALAVALRALGIPASFTHPDVQAWANAGVTVQQIREAARIAMEDRKKPTPSVGYLVGIVQDMLNPPAPRANGQLAGKPWFIAGWSHIVAKGVELGLEQGRDETDPAFRLRVFTAAGVTEDEARKAESDWKVAA